MDRAKTEAEPAEHEAPPSIETLPQPPAKQDRPGRGGQLRRKTPPAKAATTLAQAAAGAPRRAQAAGTLQRALGNERAGRAAATNAVETPAEALEFEHALGEPAEGADESIPAEALEETSGGAEGPELLIQLRRASARSASPILGARARQEARRRLRRFRNTIDQLETQRVITTEEAEGYRSWVERCEEEARALGEHSAVVGAARQQLQQRARRLMEATRRLKGRIARIRQRAQHGRSTRSLRLISNFSITPPVIRIQEGEAARISFILRKPARSIGMYILSHEGGGDVGTNYRFFNMRNTEPGYKVAIWNGTWVPGRHRPPQTGTYRLHISVTDQRGRTEEVFDQIRVENPENQVVHPRSGSGYALQSLQFNGSLLILTDAHGNTLQMRAVSGLMRHHRLNAERRDYTQGRYQWKKNRGPIPAGEYHILKNTVQAPALDPGRGELIYPRPEGSRKRPAHVRAWGPYRVPLYPNSRGNRDGFFLHLDVSNDGTAGCIGIHSGDTGKFNNLMSLLVLMPADLPVTVQYPGEKAEDKAP